MYFPTEHQIRVEALSNSILELEIEAKLLNQAGRPVLAQLLKKEAVALKQELYQFKIQTDFAIV